MLVWSCPLLLLPVWFVILPVNVWISFRRPNFLPRSKNVGISRLIGHCKLPCVKLMGIGVEQVIGKISREKYCSKAEIDSFYTYVIREHAQLGNVFALLDCRGCGFERRCWRSLGVLLYCVLNTVHNTTVIHHRWGSEHVGAETGANQTSFIILDDETPCLVSHHLSINHKTGK